MGEYGRRRVNDELELRYEVPKLLAAYDMLFEGTGGGAPTHVAAERPVAGTAAGPATPSPGTQGSERSVRPTAPVE